MPFATSRFSATVALHAARCGRRRSSWFSACWIRCSSCQRSAVDSPRVDPLELGLRRLELLLGARVVDLLRVDGVVDERDRAVELDLEEAGPGRELEHLVRRRGGRASSRP